MTRPRSLSPLLLLLLLLLLQTALVVRAFVARSSLPRPRQQLVLMASSPKPPTGLSLEQVSSKLKFEVTDLDEGIYGLESKVRTWAVWRWLVVMWVMDGCCRRPPITDAFLASMPVCLTDLPHPLRTTPHHTRTQTTPLRSPR